MSHVLEVDDQGSLRLSPQVLGHVKPHTRFVVENHGDALVLRPANGARVTNRASPQERASVFRQWAESHIEPRGPGLPDEALRRENIYE